MLHHSRIFRWLFVLFLSVPLFSVAATPVKSMVIFGDSMSDIGNTTHLLKSLRQEDDPVFIIEPFKAFVINKMVEFADDYHVPQMVLDSGVAMVSKFFDHEVAPYIANLVGKVRAVPLLPGEPYWKARFSNGRVWNEYLARMLSIESKNKEFYLNRSFGGSWAATYDYQLTVWNLIHHPLWSIKNLIVGKLVPPSLGLAVQTYLMEYPKLSDETVYFIFAGGNDYMNVLYLDENYNTEVMSAYIDNVILGVGNSISKLAKAGAKRFVVIGVPSLGEAPRNVQTGDRAVLNAAVSVHNERLKHLIPEWQALYPGSDFLYVDIGAYLNRILQHPEEYGFTNVSEPCIDVKLPMYHAFTASPFAKNYVLRYAQVLQYKDKSFVAGETNYHVCAKPDNYLFWDEIHPTTRAHAYFAFEVCQAMQEHGYSVTCKKLM